MLIVDVVFVGIVCWIPDLGKEGVTFCDFVVIPGHGEAFGAPVAAEQDEIGRCFEGMAELAFPLEFGETVAGRHFGREAFAAAEFGGFFHVVEVPFAHRLGFIVAVIEVDRFVAGARCVEVFPAGDGGPFFVAAIVGRYAVLIAVFDPVLRAEALFVGHGFHAEFDEESRAKFGQMIEPGHRFAHLFEVLFDGDVRAEMQVIFEHIRILVPVAVEISEREPVGFEDFFGFGARNRVEQEAFEFVVGEPIFGA